MSIIGVLIGAALLAAGFIGKSETPVFITGGMIIIAVSIVWGLQSDGKASNGKKSSH